MFWPSVVSRHQPCAVTRASSPTSSCVTPMTVVPLAWDGVAARGGCSARGAGGRDCGAGICPLVAPPAESPPSPRLTAPSGPRASTTAPQGWPRGGLHRRDPLPFRRTPVTWSPPTGWPLGPPPCALGP